MELRVLSAQIAHETNTFSKLRTDENDYRSRAWYFGPEIRAAFAGTRSEIAAHLDHADAHDWKLVQPIACSATPSGPTTAQTWRHVKAVLETAARSGKYDGALIALHGAMVTETGSDADGEIMELLRNALGPDVPIVATVDLHANISDRLARNVNGIAAYRTYPHVDQYETAIRSAMLLERLMRSGERTSVHVLRLPTLEGCDFGRTDGPIMRSLLSLADQLTEQESRCRSIAICAGFPWADVAYAGPSVSVTWQGRGFTKEFGHRLLQEIWQGRGERSVEVISIQSAAQRLRAWNGPGALVISDFTDNPGAGGYGDSVTLLRALIESGVSKAAFAAISDPQSVARCRDAGVGGTADLVLGSRIDPALYGPPLRVKAKVLSLTDGAVKFAGPMLRGLQVSLGDTATVQIGSVRVIVSSRNMQVFDTEIFRSQGIEVSELQFIGVKSAHHFRSAFGIFAGEILLVDGGGLISPDLTRFHYRAIRRPIWPLDQEAIWP